MVSAVTFGKREPEIWQLSGQPVHVEQTLVAGAADHVIVISGPWESAEQLGSIARALNAQGISATLLHLPGCGRTPDLPGTEYASWVALIEALCQRERRDEQKLVLLGIGLGGTLAFHAAAKGAPIDALCMTAVGDPRRDALRRRILGDDWPPLLTTLGMQWLSPLIGDRRWVPPGVAARPLSLLANPAPLPRHSLRWLSSFLTYAPAVEPEEFRRCPVVLLAPTADRWLQLEPSLDFYRRLPGDKQLHMLEGAEHLPVDAASAEMLVHALRHALGHAFHHAEGWAPASDESA